MSQYDVAIIGGGAAGLSAALVLSRARISPVTAIATLPIALWEFSLGLRLTFRGFRPSPLTAGTTTAAALPARHDVTDLRP